MQKEDILFEHDFERHKHFWSIYRTSSLVIRKSDRLIYKVGEKVNGIVETKSDAANPYASVWAKESLLS